MARNLIPSDASIRAVKAGDERARLNDGEGLYLLLFVKGGAHGWRFDYTSPGGSRKTISLGTYPTVGLSRAREDAEEKRRMVAAGIDPSEARKAKKADAARQEKAVRAARAGGAEAGTFKADAVAWLEFQKHRWSARTLAMIQRQFEADAYPYIGHRLTGTLTALEILEVVQRVERRGAGEQASRLLLRIKGVFRHALVHTRSTKVNVTLDLVSAEVLRPRRVRHRAALPESELTKFWSELDAYSGDPGTVNALLLLLYCVPRPGELRFTPWDELPPGAKQWRIGAYRMKMKEEHITPLPRQAIEVIERQRRLSGTDVLVFPSPYYPGKALSDSTLNSALARMGYKGKATAHGFRALFSTVANEHGWDADVIERQLAHKEQNETRAAYHRALYLKERAELLQWWADYVDSKKQPTAVKKAA